MYRYAIQPAARSPMNSVGLANIKYVRYHLYLGILNLESNEKFDTFY